MKRPSYHEATYYIAANDNYGNGDELEQVAAYVSVVLVAELWGLDVLKVARDVIGTRVRIARQALKATN
jgi:hypothetical protein